VGGTAVEEENQIKGTIGIAKKAKMPMEICSEYIATREDPIE
jgi:hypothetical protein